MVSSRIDKLLGSMSLEQKVGQVFIFTFVSQQQALNDLKFHPAGYVRIYSDCLSAARQHRELQARSELPLIISADFERGIGSTISGAIELVGNMCLGAAGDEQLAFATGRAIAEEARLFGVNMNYVPVLDVNVNENNPIINIRSFGADPHLVARLGAAFIKGTQAGRVLTCGKHFPGHGDTQTDSHTSLGVIDVDRKRLDEVELVPFRAAIEAGVDSIMSAHLAIPAIEPERLPATMSRRVMQNLLRDELGFTGAAISDAMEMGAITRSFTPAEAIVRAFNAGCDQLIMPVDNAFATSTLINAVRKRDVTEARLNEAVGRILALKEKAGLFDDSKTAEPDLLNDLHRPENFQVALDAALAGITLVRNRNNLVPVKPEQSVAVVSFSGYEDGRSYFLEPKSFAAHLENHVREVHAVNAGLIDERMVHEFNVVKRAKHAAARADVIVLAAYMKVVINRGSMELDARYIEFVAELASTGKPMVMISFGSPYIIKQFPRVDAYICAYGSSEAAQQAAAALVAGKAPFRGKLPVPLTGV